eukprot:gnl/TRDRNA2_/TRDRNA2_199467_c0_seq1.p3 gnl/TRDRNA2_/TRDRNA2_199467_c0~~gnl/TRDRNA2_/TRDRNA2_199467_c0_seq1.p3  ORF type:complete len:138 (+),score=16.59 gnl/TRDRNA2_/TRDRNA2_199467_c0_seq1:143-556(+)
MHFDCISSPAFLSGCHRRHWARKYCFRSEGCISALRCSSSFANSNAACAVSTATAATAAASVSDLARPRRLAFQQGVPGGVSPGMPGMIPAGASAWEVGGLPVAERPPVGGAECDSVDEDAKALASNPPLLPGGTME